MALLNDCCCGSRCSLGGKKCDSQHRCLTYHKFIHGICGVASYEGDNDPRYNLCFARTCFDCHEKANNKSGDDSSANDDLPIASLGRKRAVAAPKKKAPAPKKTKIAAPKKRPPRPEVVYRDDPAADPTSWAFPADRPEYLCTYSC